MLKLIAKDASRCIDGVAKQGRNTYAKLLQQRGGYTSDQATERADQVNEATALALALHADGNPLFDMHVFFFLLTMTPWLAVAELPDLFLPEDIAATLRTPLTHVDALGLLRQERREYHQPTVRSEPKPGRNDPCSCNSGKKYKRCCGG